MITYLETYWCGNNMTEQDLIQELSSIAKGISILYVEDDKDIRDYMNILLKSFFDTTYTAENGKEALEIYEKKHIDIILSDIAMPIMDGIEFSREIKKRNPSQNIIITSAFEESAYFIELINIGVNKFILKPPSNRQLFETLIYICRLIQNDKELERHRENAKLELIENRELLRQYKDVVDQAALVTKTDLNGTITYVNDNYCKSTGYSREELLGGNHKILRHPDVPSSVYAQMWKDIQAKKTWKGVIKNYKKDRSEFIAQTLIAPILNSRNEIQEYIGIRHDITAMVHLSKEIEETQREMLYILGEMGETRSQETGFHVKRVAKYSLLLARLFGLSEEEAILVYIASPMHDIGKIAIPDRILLKPGKLTDDEFEEMKRHATYGYDIFKSSSRPTLQAAAIIAHEHHEKYDGSGYPRGLKGEEIHPFGRIVALADVFDALSTKRVYKDAWPMDKVLEFLKEQKDKHFDPQLVDLLLENLEEFLAIKERYSVQNFKEDALY